MPKDRVNHQPNKLFTVIACLFSEGLIWTETAPDSQKLAVYVGPYLGELVFPSIYYVDGTIPRTAVAELLERWVP